MKLRNKKTGEIVELKLIEVNDEYLGDHEVDSLNGEKLTIELLANSFDDAKEPLIKDEKIRKALRVWADENRIEKVGFKLDKGSSSCACYFYDESCDICEFGLKFYIDIEHDRIYTIAELCGDEE